MNESDGALRADTPPKPGPAPGAADPEAVRARVDGLLGRIDAAAENGTGVAGGLADGGRGPGADTAALFDQAHRVLSEALSTVDGV